MTQPDLLHNSPPELAKVWRIWAETERRNPWFSPTECEERANRALREAERIERESKP